MGRGRKPTDAAAKQRQLGFMASFIYSTCKIFVHLCIVLLSNFDMFIFIRVIKRETKPAAWDESNQILSVLPVHSFGTWFGISKQGRLVFLVNPPKLNNLSPVLRPVDFLLREMSPWEFAREWSEKSNLAKIMNRGMTYHIVVADINSKSMVYISKGSAKDSNVHTEEVGFGVHTLSSSGLDIQFPEYLHRLKTFSCEIMSDIKDKEVTPMKELAERFTMYDPFETDKEDSEDIFGKVRQYEITSTIALAVKRNKEVMFHERFWENGKWNPNDVTFNIT
ncbi:unnamed protein product [Arabidopsis halleri]